MLSDANIADESTCFRNKHEFVEIISFVFLR